MTLASDNPSTRDLLTSVALHVLALALLMLLPAEMLSRTMQKKEIDVVLYRPRPPLPVPAPVIPPPPPPVKKEPVGGGARPEGAPPAPIPKPSAPPGPPGPAPVAE